MRRIPLVLATALLAASAAAPAHARTKLVTLPSREVLVVNLEHPHYTLLMEERELALQQGPNHIDFSWQGVRIDPFSIQIELLSNPGEEPGSTRIVSVSMPPNEQALTWALYSPEARTERVRVSYLLHDVGRNTTYEMTVDAAEAEARLRHDFEVRNRSGEDLDNAAFRVGMADDWTRSIRDGEVRRFLAATAGSVPIRKAYESRPAPFSTRGDDGEPIGLLYEFENSAASGLGAYLMPAGRIRVFAADPDGSTIFIGEDLLAATPTGEEASIRLGSVQDVSFKRRILADRRVNERRNDNNRVVLHDRLVELRYEIENFKDEPAVLRIVETLPREAVVDLAGPGIAVERRSATEMVVEIELEPRPTGPGAEVPKREVSFSYRVPNILN